ncbi:lipoamidase activity protein [Pleosporales sp. CAS-2024a]
MPKSDKAPATHRSPVSTASAAGGGTRSSSWSAKDDETLIQARAQGLNWNQISPKHFPQKSSNACRKRHERLMERQNAEQWDGVKLDILAQAYMDVRRDMWSILAARVGEKWTLVEQKCMEKGLKNLNQAWRSAQKKQNDGSYHDHEDSGVGISDLDEESSPADMLPAGMSDAHFSGYPGGYASHQRVPSIQSMIHPQHAQYHHQPAQYMPHPLAHSHQQPHPNPHQLQQ